MTKQRKGMGRFVDTAGRVWVFFKGKWRLLRRSKP